MSKTPERLLRIKETLSRTRLSPGRKALVLGCGEGEVALYLGRQGLKVFAVDIDPVKVATAKKHSNNKNVMYLVMDATKCEINKKFDIIVITGMLEHMAPNKIHELIKTINIHSHLKTILYVNVPVSYFVEFGRERLDNKNPINAIEFPLLLRLLDASGYVPMSIEAHGTKSPFEYYDGLFVTKEHAQYVWEAIYINNQAFPNEGNGSTESLEGGQ